VSIVLVLVLGCGGEPDGTTTDTTSPTTTSGAVTGTLPTTGTWPTLRQHLYAVRCYADAACANSAWASVDECLACAPPEDWGDPPVTTNGEACIAEVQALAAEDPCAAASLWPVSDTCSVFFSEVGQWPPEEAAMQSVVWLIREAWSTCDPTQIAPKVCDSAPGQCSYNPSNAAACLDAYPWGCSNGVVPWGGVCDDAWVNCPTP